LVSGRTLQTCQVFFHLRLQSLHLRLHPLYILAETLDGRYVGSNRTAVAGQAWPLAGRLGHDSALRWNAPGRVGSLGTWSGLVHHSVNAFRGHG